jgi:hypothetical protein
MRGERSGMILRSTAAGIVLLAAATVTVSPLLAATGAASFSATAAGAAPTTTFVSKRYGYTITLPGPARDWSASYAFANWSIGTISASSPAFDTFTDNRNNSSFSIGAFHEPAGTTLAKWTAFVIAAVPPPPNCTKPKPLASSTLSGAPARILRWTCSDGTNLIGIAALHGTRGYFMWLGSSTSLSQASDQSLFDAARKTFRFT